MVLYGRKSFLCNHENEEGSNGIQIDNGEILASGALAVVDSGIRDVWVPKLTLDEINGAIKVTGFENDFYTVDCSQIGSMPTIHILNLGGKRLSLKPEYYTEKVANYPL
ncbi:hypothetical protein X801_05706 [Opisthorchis viverrini]|uniref:Peptidase A1 domain-containing protein n=1 Tax=Opisthorchis viverrini TaxID=6198 RepID=A0A1S8WVN5_OPIVI|nr:hypothetical protein X801_05706 [Opisthorchis viverrini]